MIFVSPPSPTFLCSRFISTHSLFFLWQLLREGGVRLYWAQRYAPPFAVSSGRRQAEGIAAAKAKGVRFGRPPKPNAREFPFCLPALENGRNHRDGSSKGMWDAPCYLPLPGRDLRKSQVVVKEVFLQKCVPFCKENMTSFLFADLWGFSPKQYGKSCRPMI